MIELRWVLPESTTTTQPPRLQYRQCGEWPAAWGEWCDVPVVVLKDEPKPAPSVRVTFPNRFPSTNGHSPVLQLMGDRCLCERCEADRKASAPPPGGEG